MEHRGFGVVLLLTHALLSKATFRYEDCSTADNIVDFSEFTVLPDPVDMRRNLTVSLRGDIRSEIPPTAKLEIKYYRTRQVFGVQLDILIPCLLGKYGSCVFPLCDYMDRFRTQVCPFLANDTSCECPPKPGRYDREDVEIEMAATNAVGRFIAKGRYRTEMRLRDSESDVELACYKFYTELI